MTSNDSVRQRWINEGECMITSNGGQRQTENDIERTRRWVNEGVGVGRRRIENNIKQMKTVEWKRLTNKDC